MKEPNFFILGAPKCGTTAMASYLSEHPEVFMTDPKEPHHYNTDHRHGSYKDRQKYLSLFTEANDTHKIVGEASVWYLYSEEAVPNIIRDYPDARFLVMFRNPLEMAPSLYRQQRFTGHEPARTFQEAWELQAARRHGERVPHFCTEPRHLLYKEACSLGQQFDRLLRHVDRTQVLAIVHDDFKANPAKVWQDTLDFLQVNYMPRANFSPVNTAKLRRSFALLRLCHLSVVVGRNLGLKRLPEVKRPAKRVLDALDSWNRKKGAYFDVSRELKKEMADTFSDDVFLLSELLNRDLSHWLRI